MTCRGIAGVASDLSRHSSKDFGDHTGRMSKEFAECDDGRVRVQSRWWLRLETSFESLKIRLGPFADTDARRPHVEYR
jgi:hypothetical protein